MSERDELIALNLAHYSKIISDDYPSTFIRTNEEAADLVLKWLAENGYQKVPEGLEWHEVRMHGYLSSGDILIIGPLFESEKAEMREYQQTIGTTPWKPVEDDDE